MYPRQVYRLNHAVIASEQMDNHYVIIHLEEGTYYQVQGLSAYIWKWLLHDYHTEEIAQHLVSRYPNADQQEFQDFLKVLFRERLLVTYEANSLRTIGDTPPPYEKPELLRHDDLQSEVIRNPLSYKNQFTLANPNIVADVFEDEVVVVHLVIGIYYSLRNASRDLWIWLIEENASIGEILEHLIASYEHPPRDLEQALMEWIMKMMREERLLKVDTTPPPSRFKPTSPAEKKAFTVFEFERFGDLQNMLLLDPVHEVDPEEGWPYKQDS